MTHLILKSKPKIVNQNKIEMDNSILITFGEPKHGWLPVIFHHRKFHLDFEASDVLNDPTEELIEAITNQSGIKRVTWWLEPAAYYFEIEKNEQNVTLTIIETDDINNESAEEKLLIKIIGSEKEIIEPILNSLKQFSSKEYEEIHWPYHLGKKKI